MTEMHSHHARRSRNWLDHIDLMSVALLLVALVAIVLVLIGVAQDGTSPLWAFVPTAFAVWNILTLRRH
ncbi:hypothetical protein [Curtobacterium sp. VKM Ac-1376]|uniref:hypothetical protein n=1 Tax=Curtobacterium sp. VKM Ac-1376 TaxID=123312 RepID=UPI00188C9C46|nr:hypothetical protein [Curtobacterium sp. VKM Ac-1376]MBF4613783.1 hypothetical protein [Curtobacterium sp. VKM Ac-1376]